MGWFGKAIRSIGRAIGRGVEKVGEVTGIEKIKQVGRGIQDACREKTDDLAKDTSQAQEYDKEKARIEETRRINEILSAYSLSLEEQADELERNCIKESSEFFDRLIGYLEESNSKELTVNTKRLKKAFKDIEKTIDGNIKRHLAKRVSLDDSECLEILKMAPGEMKKRAMKRFGQQVFREGLNQLSDKIRDMILEQQEYLSEVLEDHMQEVMNLVQKQHQEWEQIEELKNRDEEQLKKQTESIEFRIRLCDYALEEINKVS
jgi:hypothetical protein